VRLLAPLAPHIADELWNRLHPADDAMEPVEFLYDVAWPISDPAVAAEDEVTLILQINGKVRDRLVLPAAEAAVGAACEAAALSAEKIQAEIAGKTGQYRALETDGLLLRNREFEPCNEEICPVSVRDRWIRAFSQRPALKAERANGGVALSASILSEGRHNRFEVYTVRKKEQTCALVEQSDNE
jgi:leucyl-tRNA synthetase